jgi:putative salt-induced outer membrane protein YdiY
MGSRLVRLALASVLLHPAIAQPDELIFKNGDHLTGKLVRLEKKSVTFESASAGKVTVPVSKLDGIRTEEEVEIYLKDGTFVTSRVERDDSGAMRFGSDASTALDLGRVDKINPEKPRWKGKLMAGLALERGDTDKNEANVEFDARWRGERWRYQFRFLYEGERSRSSGGEYQTTDRLYRARTQLDRFLRKKLFAYGRLRAEKDGTADLNLRTQAGFGLGYQLIDRSDLTFSVQAGGAWVREDYDDDSLDTDYPAGVALWDMQAPFNERVSFFHEGEWVPSLREFNDIQLLTTETGLHIDLMAGWFTEAKVRWELDTEVAEGKERSNAKYIFALGWGF